MRRVLPHSTIRARGDEKATRNSGWIDRRISPSVVLLTEWKIITNRVIMRAEPLRKRFTSSKATNTHETFESNQCLARTWD